MTTTGDHPTAPGHNRLNGWKEIAAHCDKGVRTVQRWERELGLPVHRLRTARAETVYALAEELDAWLGESESTRATDAASMAAVAEAIGADLTGRAFDADRGEPAAVEAPGGWFSRAPRWLLPVASIGTAIVILAAGAMAIPRLRSFRRGAPVRMVADLDSVTALDAGDREVWRYSFNFPLDAANYRPGAGPPGLSVYEIADIDGDGSREVLFRAFSAKGQDVSLYCFEQDGGFRFAWNQREAVTFGDVVYQPPFRVQAMVPGARNGHPVVWVTAVHTPYFPSVLVALNAKTGRAETQFWNPGNLNTVTLARAFGREVVLVGGVDNELKAPIIIAVDPAAATGSLPVDNPHYRCPACPQAPPLAAMVFPVPDLVPLSGNGGLAGVRTFNVRPKDEVLAQLVYPTLPYAGDASEPVARGFYTIDSEWRVLHAEFGAEYEKRHKHAEAAGLIPHPFSQDEEKQLLPVRVSMNGGPWVERGPEE